MKTEYRIVPLEFWTVMYYFLQFKHKEVIRSKKYWLFGPIEEETHEVWRFVPNNHFGRVRCSSLLYQENCPTRIGEIFYHRYFYAYNHSIGSLKLFARDWPNIENYFQWLRSVDEQDSIRDTEERKSAEITYL